MISDPPVLSGRRVALRPYAAGFTSDELRDLYRWSRDSEVLALSGGAPLDMSFERFRETFLRQLAERNTRSEQLFAILDEGGRLIGRTGLFAIDPTEGVAELGIVIGEPHRWGLGYGRDAVKTLVDFGLQELALNRIVLFTYAENERARRAYEAAGFRPVREWERFSLHHGTYIELEMEIALDKP